MKAFKSMLTITAILYSIAAIAHNFEVDGIYYNIISSEDLTVEVTYRGDELNSYSNSNVYTGEVSIPEEVVYNGDTYSVTSIGDGAFYGCSNLTSVNIPSSVKSVGKAAFHNTEWWNSQLDGLVYIDCYLLGYKGEKTIGNIEIKEGTKVIGNFAFYNCSNLTSITIPNSVTNIGEGAFFGCRGLTSITLPNSITNIESCTFYACSSLANVNIPSSVTSIGESAFSSCSSLTNITIPNSVKSIGDGAFQECKNLTNITLPNSVTSIGNYMFRYCSSLTNVDIPGSVKSIGWRAFSDCTNLTSITIANPIPPTIVYNDTFSNECYKNATLYVPKGSLESYQTATSWSNFLHVEEYDTKSIESAQADNALVTVPIYNLQGQLVKEHRDHLSAGVYIQGGKKFIVK